MTAEKLAGYVVPVAISLTIFSVAGYFLYKKYKPLIDAANAANATIGTGETLYNDVITKPLSGIEEFFSQLFGSNNGNSYATTPFMNVTPNNSPFF